MATKAAATKDKKTATPKVKKVAKAAAPASTEAKTKKFQDYTIVTKRSGRYEVIGKNGKNVNGLDKAKVLVEAKLIKTGLSKKSAPEAAAEGAPAAE